MKMDMRLPVNPYVAGAPLRQERGFFGRQDTLAWVARELRNPATNALVLFGQRRIGKTTLLLQLERTLSTDAFLPVYFDLQDLATRSLKQVLADLADTVAERVGLGLLDSDVFDPQGCFFRGTFLSQLYDVLGEERRPIFLLDEFDVLDWAAEAELPETAAAKALFPFLRRVMTEDPCPAFVFVVGRRAEDLALDFVATFKVALAREIWVLDRESAEALVRQAEADNTLHFTDDAVARILSLTSGHPYLTQLLCQRVWERAYAENPTGPPLVDTSEVKVAVSDALEAGHQALVWLWNGLSPAEKIYVAALAETADEGETISEDKVIQVLTEHAARLRTREVELAPRDLVKRRVLEMTGERKYRFAVELFRRWVHQNKPLWDVKGELDRVDPLAESLFSVGQGAFRRLQWEDATRYFQDALKANPRHFRAQLHLGEALLELNQIDEAVAELERAFGLDQDEAHYALARALVVQAKMREKEGDEDGALAACDRALQVSPSEWAAQEIRTAIWTRRGEAALERDDLEQAQVAYREAGDTEGVAQVEALLQRRALTALETQARAYERAEQWAEAIEVLEKIVALDPTYKDSSTRLEQARERHGLQYGGVTPEDLYARGIEYLRRKSWEEAAAMFRQLIKIDPGYKDALRKLDEAEDRVSEFKALEKFYDRSKVCLDKEQWEAAIRYLKRIVDSGEEYRDTAVLLEEAEKQLNLQTLYANASAQLEQQKWKEAIGLLEEIVRIDRTYEDCYIKLEQAQEQYKLQKLYTQVLDHFREENWSQAIRDLNTILRENPDYRDAADKLNEAQEQQEIAALYSAGVGFLETGRWTEAVERFVEIIRRIGVYKDTVARLAQAQRQRELITSFEQGTDHLRRREWQEALSKFEEVRALDPNYLSVGSRIEEARKQLRLEELHKRGEASLRAENWQEAVEVFAELCKLAPGDPSATTKLEQARRQLELDKSYREGMKYFRDERWRKAGRALGRVVRLAPNYRDAAVKLEVTRERLARSSVFVEILRDPLWQGIGAVVTIIALAITAYPTVKGRLPIIRDGFFGLVNPTSTPKPPGLCNGGFQHDFECWQHGGELDQSVECNGESCYAILGNPDYSCHGGVPVGEAWIAQTVEVPELISPALSLQYRVFSQDLDLLDYFQIAINGEPLPQRYGNYEWNEQSCDLGPWDSGWRTLPPVDLSAYRGKEIDISFHNFNGTQPYFNTWTYVDNIRVGEAP